ncbi:hypothetical protein [Streptomyces sp. NPDC058745]|uniref:hypothetical protein n=1 Tax=Streptomyces sp. NPDC058745 TaxID=3346621 RepID=UPI003684F1C6
MNTRHVAGQRRSATPDPQRMLGIYLNDHLAGSSGGVALIRHAARNQRHTPAGPPLARLAEQIAQDRDSLRSLMTALDVPVKRRRIALGRLAETVGRAKPNGRLLSRSPLSDVLELEAMRIGVEGKTSLWESLRIDAETDRRLPVNELDRLLARAHRQADVLKDLTADAARRCFDAEPGTPEERGHSVGGAAEGEAGEIEGEADGEAPRGLSTGKGWTS